MQAMNVKDLAEQIDRKATNRGTKVYGVFEEAFVHSVVVLKLLVSLRVFDDSCEIDSDALVECDQLWKRAVDVAVVSSDSLLYKGGPW